jgi:hypothetical protein
MALHITPNRTGSAPALISVTYNCLFARRRPLSDHLSSDKAYTLCQQSSFFTNTPLLMIHQDLSRAKRVSRLHVLEEREIPVARE